MLDDQFSELLAINKLNLMLLAEQRAVNRCGTQVDAATSGTWLQHRLTASNEHMGIPASPALSELFNPAEPTVL